MLHQLPAVDVEDLPCLAKVLVVGADAATASSLVAALRSGLHFMAPGDPRLPGERGKESLG